MRLLAVCHQVQCIMIIRKLLMIIMMIMIIIRSPAPNELGTCSSAVAAVDLLV